MTHTEDSRPSVYDHILAHLPADGPGLLEGGETLPDEQEETGDDEPRWAPGAWEGVVTHHMGSWDDADDADDAGEGGEELEGLFAAIQAAVDSDLAPEQCAELHECVRRGDGFVTVVDALLERVANAGLPVERLRDLALRLAMTSPDQGTVKLGTALLGLVRTDAHREVLMTLGRHEDLTLYAAVALGNALDDPEPALWELASRVDGWGRIEVVERLADTQRPEIKDWILREGFRNSVSDTYLAHIAADTGDLAGALAAGDVDEELLHSAGDILTALAEGPPGPGMVAYPDGARATELFVGHMAERADDLADFLAVHAVKEYVADAYDDENWELQASRGWTPELRERMAEHCARILDRPLWHDLAAHELESTDPTTFWRADSVARILGIPTLPAHLRRLRHDPRDTVSWLAAMGDVEETTIDEVLDLAVRSLPLDGIATGPSRRLWYGAGFEPHDCLDSVVQSLDRWPGRGWPLIATALASPVIRNRLMAAQALAAWERSTWPAGAEPILREAIAHEPDEDVKDTLQRVLDGLPISAPDELDFDIDAELAKLENPDT